MNGANGIEGLLGTAMESLRKMVNVNTVIGDPISMGEGTTIIPISKVSLGFMAGGGEYGMPENQQATELPFGGGSGGGMSVKPIGFLINNNGMVKFMSVDGQEPLEKLVDMAPDLITKFQSMFEK